MSPLPLQMADRWHARQEPKPGQARLYWHIMLNDQPEAAALAAVAQRRLSPFPGLHFTPLDRLHVTVLPVGLAEDIGAARAEDMTSLARERLREVAPVSVTFGAIGYYPEAITLGIQPAGALDPVSDAVRAAARQVIGEPRDDVQLAWTPHITVAYSTSAQPADPIIAALGRELPTGQLTVDKISLVAQFGAERDWDWRSLAKIPLSALPPR